MHCLCQNLYTVVFTGRFILCDTGAVYNDSLDPYDETGLEEAREAEKRRRQELVDQVEFTQ